MSKLFKSIALLAVMLCATKASFAQGTHPYLSIACTGLTTTVNASVTYSKLSGGVFTGQGTSFTYSTTGTNYIPVISTPFISYRLESITFTFNGNVYTVSRATLDMYGSFNWVDPNNPGNTLIIVDLGNGNYSFNQS